MKDNRSLSTLAFLGLVGFVTVLGIFAAAIYRTWTEAHMTIITVAVAIAIVSLPVTLLILVVNYAVDERRASKAERALKRENDQLLAALKIAKEQTAVMLAAQRVQTEEYRSIKAAANVPQLPASSGQVEDPWAYSDEWGLGIGEDDPPDD